MESNIVINKVTKQLGIILWEVGEAHQEDIITAYKILNKGIWEIKDCIRLDKGKARKIFTDEYFDLNWNALSKSNIESILNEDKTHVVYILHLGAKVYLSKGTFTDCYDRNMADLIGFGEAWDWMTKSTPYCSYHYEEVK